MKFYSFILITIAVFMLQPDKGVNCKSYHMEYKNYIERVISYIYSQIISYQKQDSNNTTGTEVTPQPKTDLCDFTQKYYYTISVLNFKYLEIIQEFIYYMNIITDKCNEFKKENLLENFIDCVTFLEKQLKNSKTMFENFYNAVKFISYIDIRFLFSESTVPHAIIDEMDFMYQYVLEKNKKDSRNFKRLPYNISENTLKNFKSFTLKLFLKTFNFKTNFFTQNNILDTSINTDLLKMNIAKLTKYSKSYATLSKKSELLTKFYNENIEIWFNNLGFEQFLNPTTAEFIPPMDPDTNQNGGIEALNIIRKETGWKEMNHINIIYFGKLQNVDGIIKDEVNNINFRIKKEQVLQLLICRYTEIIKNYHTILSAILTVCKKDALDFYHNCLIKLFSSFSESKKMIEGLYESLITLNKSLICSVHLNSESSLQNILKWITGFLNILKNNNFSQENFIVLYDKNKIEIVEKHLVIFENYLYTFSNQLQSDFNYYFNDFRSELQSDNSQIKGQCYINEPFKNEESYIENFKNLQNKSIYSNIGWPFQIILNACNYFDKFCEDVYKSCYENLGFRKLLHYQNKS